MMTRKHFVSIAKVLDANITNLPIVLDFADMLEEENPNFDRARFVEAATGQLREHHAHVSRMLDKAVKGKA